MRTKLLGFVALLVPLAGTTADTKDAAGPETTSRACHRLQREYNAARQAYSRAFLAARTDDAKREAGKLLPKAETFAEKFLDLALKDTKDPFAYESLAWVVTHVRQGPALDAAVNFLIEDHLQRERLGSVCLGLMYYRSPPADKLLKAAYKDSPHREVKAFAGYVLGNHLKEQAESVRRAQDPEDADYAQRMEKQLGAERFNELKNSDPNKLLDEAEAVFNRIRTTCGDIELRTRTVAEVIDDELYELRSLAIGERAPDIIGEDLNGKPFKLSDYRGKVVMISFFGNWCPPCRAMFPHERSLVKNLASKPFVLLGVNSDEDCKEFKKVQAKENLTWRCWFDGGGTSGPIASKWNVHSWPTIYVLDHKGIIRHRDIREKELELAIERVIKEAEIDLAKAARQEK